MLLLVTSSYGNNENNEANFIAYHVVKNGDIIGTIHIVKSQTNDEVIYELESKISAKFILKFDIIGKEKSIYKNGTLIYSHVYRKVNNKVKTDHEIELKKDIYESGKNALNLQAIHENIIKLYFVEPLGLHEIFSDNMKRMVSVTSLGHGKYRVEFSKNKYNIFHYENGRCVKVEAVSNLFDVELIIAAS
jgi:hypothetical protein